mgnify:FL=1|tara:strand:+ start:2352 stop:3656 length:1305 start_codon:yes stop_codon:yes gene_type:complete
MEASKPKTPDIGQLSKITWSLLKNISIQFVFMLAFIIILCFFFLFMKVDKNALSKNFIMYMVFFGIIAVSGFLVLYSNIHGRDMYGIITIMVFALLFLLIQRKSTTSSSINKIFHFFFRDYPQYSGLSRETSFIVGYALKMILVLIILLGLSIFYNLFLNQTYREKNVYGFIIQFVFFIPCLLSDIVRYLINDIVSTPKLVYVILGIEIALVLIYFILPKILKKSNFDNGAQLLKEPSFLSDRKTLDNCNYVMNRYMKDKKALKIPDSSNHIGPSNLNDFNNYNFAFSMWLNTNESDLSHNVFYYGNNQVLGKKGKPYIYYNGNGEHTFVLTDISGEETPSYTTNLLSQRWNHIVVNYTRSRCDLFINGHLRHTVQFTSNIPYIKMTYANNIVVGDTKENLHGAICNIMVYRKPMTAEQIANTYNILHLRNPPV